MQKNAMPKVFFFVCVREGMYLPFVLFVHRQSGTVHAPEGAETSGPLVDPNARLGPLDGLDQSV